MGKKERMLSEQFLKSQYWNEILKPFLEKKIESNSKITAIKEADIERTYLKAVSKRSVYIGIRNAIENEWPEKVDSDENVKIK